MGKLIKLQFAARKNGDDISDFTIYYDSLQEGEWFRGLDARMRGANMVAMTATVANGVLASVLKYDRPDIVLANGATPILVVERTEEVPSGHNVGQRFARLVAAAHERIPVIYMFPYAARKHGGATAGPRYANLRLFRALDRLSEIHDTSVVAVNWPVDHDCELLRGVEKDRDVGRLVSSYLDEYAKNPSGANARLQASKVVSEIRAEATEFEKRVLRRKVYDFPPDSVRFISPKELRDKYGVLSNDLPKTAEVLIYIVGMTYLRSDPYTGMAMLYDYLYCRDSATGRRRALALHFPNLTLQKWGTAVKTSQNAKTVKLFAEVADIIIFTDGYRLRSGLLN